MVMKSVVISYFRKSSHFTFHITDPSSRNSCSKVHICAKQTTVLLRILEVTDWKRLRANSIWQLIWQSLHGAVSSLKTDKWSINPMPLWNSRIYCHDHISPPANSTLSTAIPAHSITSHFVEIFNHKPRSPSILHTVHFASAPCMLHVPPSAHHTM
jgi:hypothetical protein